MDYVANRITTGAYKNSDIILKGENADEPVLVCKGFLRKKEISMDKTTIKKVNYSFHSGAEHEVIIEWKDGTLSHVIIDNAVYSVISAKML